MSDPDPKQTLREFREYFASNYESQSKIAARVGVTQATVSDWYPMGKSLTKLWAFLDDEAKRSISSGIRPIERVPIKIVLPPRQLHNARLCPFCRKTRGKIRPAGRKEFQGVCPKCGATGPKQAMLDFSGRELVPKFP